MTDLYRSTNNLGFRLQQRDDGQWVVVWQDGHGKDTVSRPATPSEVMQWFQLKAALKE